MKLRTTIAAAAALAIAGSATFLPGAAQADDTSLTVTLTAGSLSIDAPAAASASASVTPGSTISATLTDTTVVDNRGSLLGWTVTGSSTALTHDTDPTYTIPAAALTWATGTIATTNGSLTNVAAGVGGSMGAAFAVASALLGSGAGTYTYPATITGVVPVNLKAGSYTGTVTQSIL